MLNAHHCHTCHVQGPRVASRQCLPAKCVGTTSALTSSSLDPSPSPPPRPTPVYGASPCACGCTYLLHSSREEDNTSRDINIVSGNNIGKGDQQPNLSHRSLPWPSYQLDSEGPARSPTESHSVQHLLLLPIPVPEHERRDGAHGHHPLPGHGHY